MSIEFDFCNSILNLEAYNRPEGFRKVFVLPEMLFNKKYVSQIKADAVSQVEKVFDFRSRDMSLPIARTLKTPNEENSQGGAGNLTSLKTVVPERTSS